MPEELPSFRDKTIIDRSLLEQTLAQIRQEEFAVSHEEFEHGLSAVAAPIRDHMGRVIVTVSVSGQTYRIRPGRIERFIEPLFETAYKISTSLGYMAS